jgi:predicted dienelactone hydrolase
MRFACLLWLALVFSSAAAETATGVGMHAIEVHDPVGGADMPGYVFYPSMKMGSTAIEGYDVAAVTDATPLAGVRPLIVLSHGNGGSAFDLHDLATYLAAHGFVVATLEHPRDN